MAKAYTHGLGGGGYFPVDAETDVIGTPVRWYGLRVASPSTDQSNEVIYADDEGVYDSYAGVATDNITITAYNTPEEAWRSFGKRKLGTALIRDPKAYEPFGMFYREQVEGESAGTYRVYIYYKCNGVSPTGDSTADEDSRTVKEMEHNAISVVNSTAVDDNGVAISMIDFVCDTKDPTDPNKTKYDKLYPTGATAITIPLPTDFKFPAVVVNASLSASGSDYKLTGTATGTPTSIKALKGSTNVSKGVITIGAGGKVTGLIDGTKVSVNDKITIVPVRDGLDGVGKTVTVEATANKETFTAWAYNKAGTDRLMVNYPNFNLLSNTKYFGGTWNNATLWTDDGTYKGLSVKKRTEPQKGTYKIWLAPADGVYTFSEYVKSTGPNAKVHGVFSKNGVRETDRTFGDNFDWIRDSLTRTLAKNDSIIYSYEMAGTAVDSTIWVAGPKIEAGSVATEWMPMESEATDADIPKYVGSYVGTAGSTQSTNPSSYTWREINPI